jgi:hypothetical protein
MPVNQVEMGLKKMEKVDHTPANLAEVTSSRKIRMVADLMPVNRVATGLREMVKVADLMPVNRVAMGLREMVKVADPMHVNRVEVISLRKTMMAVGRMLAE